jgi:predicted nuclease with TOPRIM domain
MKKDALKLEVENLRSLREEVAALNEQLDGVITERDQLIQERDNLIFVSECQAAVLEAMQKDNDALKHETEYLQGQCNNVAAIKEQLKTVTAEQQRLKKVRDALHLEMEHLWGHCMDIAATTEQRDELILRGKHQARDTKAVEKALELERNVLRGQCMDAAAVKEQLSNATVQRPKCRKVVIIITMLVLCFFGGMFWMLLNTCEMFFSSLYKTSSYLNLILATAVPSHNIVI